MEPRIRGPQNRQEEFITRVSDGLGLRMPNDQDALDSLKSIARVAAPKKIGFKFAQEIVKALTAYEFNSAGRALVLEDLKGWLTAGKEDNPILMVPYRERVSRLYAALNGLQRDAELAAIKSLGDNPQAANIVAKFILDTYVLSNDTMLDPEFKDILELFTKREMRTMVDFFMRGPFDNGPEIILSLPPLLTSAAKAAGDPNLHRKIIRTIMSYESMPAIAGELVSNFAAVADRWNEALMKDAIISSMPFEEQRTLFATIMDNFILAGSDPFAGILKRNGDFGPVAGAMHAAIIETLNYANNPWDGREWELAGALDNLLLRPALRCLQDISDPEEFPQDAAFFITRYLHILGMGMQTREEGEESNMAEAADKLMELMVKYRDSPSTVDEIKGVMMEDIQGEFGAGRAIQFCNMMCLPEVDIALATVKENKEAYDAVANYMFSAAMYDILTEGKTHELAKAIRSTHALSGQPALLQQKAERWKDEVDGEAAILASAILKRSDAFVDGRFDVQRVFLN